MGYLFRSVEVAQFENAANADPALVDDLADRFDAALNEGSSEADAMAELAADLASDEPVDPTPQQGGPSWAIAGIGQQTRGRIRDELLSRMRYSPDVASDDLKRTWKYGYFLRVIDELYYDEDEG